MASPYRHAQNLARALDLFAFAKLGVVAQHHGADLILFQREGQSCNAVREGEQFARHHLVESVETRNAVAQRGDGADLVDLHL